MNRDQDIVQASHLTRAPVQVTDEDVTRACIAYNKKLGEQGEHVKPSNYATPYFMRAALESLSARLAQPAEDWRIRHFERAREYAQELGFAGVMEALTKIDELHRAQPVAAKVPDWVVNSLELIAGTRGARVASPRAEAAEVLELLSQPHPQAVQGGEVHGEAVRDAIKDIQTFARAYQAEVPRTKLTVHGISAGLEALGIYTHPAKRAAVPEGIKLAIERCLRSEEGFADRIDKENPGDEFASLAVRDDIDAVRQWLSAAPTLDGKEKG